MAGGGNLFLVNRFTTFTTIFLGIFIEAAPFLMLGTLASGVVEIFFNQDAIRRLLPRNAFMGALAGGIMGFFFPVCECGVVPLTRRLFTKGLPPAVGVAFLLASPVINPIVIASTYAAFGFSPVFWLRIGLSLFIAVTVGLIFAVQMRPERLLRPVALAPIQGGSVDFVEPTPTQPLLSRLQQALRIGADEFFEMGRYLILGSMLAALMQTFIPQTTLLALGQGPVLSIIAMMALAVILSICSTVDAFIALAFVGTFSTGSILSFLVFGPMVDIKSALMYLQVFNRKTVIYLISLPMLMSFLMALILNYYVGL
ncbi:MAG: permease [Chloroflexi bacterium]|nr:permease [Chloroflexota bacterium]